MQSRRSLRVPAIIVLSGAGLLWLGQFTNIDVAIAQLSFDPTRGHFPLRDAWFATQLFHTFAKNVAVTTGIIFIVAAIYDLFRPSKVWARETGWRIRAVAMCAVLIPGTISLLKQNSRMHCPWDLAMFGGTEPYFRLFDLIPAAISDGKCFPAGHASGGLWMASIMLFWLPGRPRRAWVIGVGMLGVGMSMGIVQQLRGAHFTTHTLWSTWIAVLIIWLAYRILSSVEEKQQCLIRR